MNLSSINNYFTNHTASVLSTGLSKKTSGNTASSVAGQPSPFAQLLSTLQQLEQSNPTQYQKATTQIATNLQSAAITATKSGNTAEATQLTTLSKDFTTASQNGQLPNVKDLAAAFGGAPHLHASASSIGSAGSVSSSASSPGAHSTLQQLLASLQSGATQNKSTNPMSIIMSTLSSAGINS